MEEKIDFDRLMWGTWLAPTSNKMIPIQVFADLIKKYHAEKNLPTVILAEKSVQAEKIAQRLDEILKASDKALLNSEEQRKIAFHFDGKVNTNN